MFRRGQWVKTTRDLHIQAEAAGQKVTVKIPAPSIGIHHPLDVEETRLILNENAEPVLDDKGEPKQQVIGGRLYHLEDSAPRSFKKGESVLVGLHLVDSETGFNTILEAAVPADAIEAVTDLNDIPAPRRATCAKGWSPRA